jgi:hypothetical protein
LVLEEGRREEALVEGAEGREVLEGLAKPALLEESGGWLGINDVGSIRMILHSLLVTKRKISSLKEGDRSRDSAPHTHTKCVP